LANYLLVYHGGSMPQSPDEQAKVMAAWGKWFGELGDAVVDGGNPVGQTRTIKGSEVNEGGGANPASGYSVIKADSMDQAVQRAKGCPILAGGGSIEVCETFNAM
jgi:hypothetical protein